MSDMVSYEFGDLAVRTRMIEGEPWFVAKDVCAALGLNNVSQALVGLDDDERGVIKADTLGGIQEVNIINESGLYSLILRSNKPEAKVFKRWVTREVLPSIRKTGAYGAAVRTRDEGREVRVLMDMEGRLERLERAVYREVLPAEYGSVHDRTAEYAFVPWSDEEEKELVRLKRLGIPDKIIGRVMGRSDQAVRTRAKYMRICGIL